jgi:hypothetical protein
MVEREEEPQDSIWYKRACEFVVQFHQYAEEKFVNYIVVEISNRNKPYDILRYRFNDIPRRIYMELLLPEARRLAERYQLDFQYTTMLPMLDGNNFGDALFEVKVPDTYYVPRTPESRADDLIVGSFNIPDVQYKSQRRIRSEEIEL